MNDIVTAPTPYNHIKKEGQRSCPHKIEKSTKAFPLKVLCSVSQNINQVHISESYTNKYQQNHLSQNTRNDLPSLCRILSREANKLGADWETNVRTQIIDVLHSRELSRTVVIRKKKTLLRTR